MSLVEKAKKKAEEEDQEAKMAKEADDRFQNGLKREVSAMSKKVIKALREFDKVKVSGGTLRLATGQKAKGMGPHEWDRIAVLNLVDDTGATVDQRLLYIDCGVHSGTFDGSDDCRNIPYTAASLHIYSDKNVYNGPYRSTRDFHESARSVEDVDKILDKVAEYLAPLFSKK